jgi:SH3 domain protein
VLLLALAASPAAAQTVRYVTDSIRMDTRRGPSNQHRIVRMVPTGTQLTVLEDRDGWSRVRLPGESGEEAWILTRFLRDDPPPRQELADARKRIAAFDEEQRVTVEELAQTRTALESLQVERDQLASEFESTHAELEDIKRTAATAVTIRDENRSLKTELASLRQSHESLTREFQLMRASRERDWFIAGGGVLFAGIVLGLVIPKIRWRRKKGWGEF